ncbi:MAG: IS630 transposase-related protein [Robiginitomaculum sp.]
MAHSMDLRLRAIRLLEKGHTVLEVSELLDIGTATLWRWKARAREGRLASTYPKVRSTYKLDEVSMLSYLDEHPDAYLHEIAQAMQVSKTAIWSSFKRLGITRVLAYPLGKKRRRNTVSVTKNSAISMRV